MALETRRLTESLIAIAGIWLVFRQLPDYAATFYMLLSENQLSSDIPSPQRAIFTTAQSVQFVSSLCAGIFLVTLRKVLARWLVPESQEEVIGTDGLLAVGIAIISFFFILSGIVSLGQYLAEYGTAETNNTFLYWNGIFSIALGVISFLFSVGIARLWRLLRGPEA